MIIELVEDIALLLLSKEGAGAMRVLLPVVRDLAMYIADRGPWPVDLPDVPELKSRASIERAHYRWEKSQGKVE